MSPSDSTDAPWSAAATLASSGVHASSSSMQGSRLFVSRMVKRTRFVRTGVMRSMFAALTEDRGLTTDQAIARLRAWGVFGELVRQLEADEGAAE